MSETMTDLKMALEKARSYNHESHAGYCDSDCLLARALLATVERAEKAEKAEGEIEKWKLKEMFFDRNLEMTKLRALLQKAEGALKAFTDDVFTGETPAQKIYRLREIARAALAEINGDENGTPK